MTYEQQKYAPETIQTPQSSSQEGFKPDLKTKIMSGAKNLKDKAIIKGKDFKTAFNNAKEVANKPKEYVDNFLNKKDVNYRTSTKPTGDGASDTIDRQENMKNTVNSTDDLIKTGEQIGAEANAALQNVEVPRSKLVSYNDILKSDEFKGQRVPYMANAIGSTLANSLSGLTGREYDSYLKQHNQAMADTYAQNKAARDTAATQANIQDIEAGNKAEMGKQVQMSDAITEQALKRYGLLEDQETKKQILNDIVKQATDKGMDKWNTLSAEEKLAAMALMQAYNGDYSVASMVIEKYGDRVFNVLDKLFGEGDGTGENGNGGNGITLPSGRVIDTKASYAEEDLMQIAREIADATDMTPKEKVEYARGLGLGDTLPMYVAVALSNDEDINNGFRKTLEKGLKGNSSEQIYDNLVAMAGSGSDVKDQSLIKEYEDALAEYGQKTVEDKINSILSQNMETQDKLKAVEKLANTDKYKNLISQNPELQKLLEDTNTDLTLKYTYIDPYTKKVAGRLYNALASSTGANKFVINDDGTIDIQLGKKTRRIYPYTDIGISNSGADPDVFLATLKDNVTIDKVRNQIDSSMTDEEIARIFKNSPTYKMISGIVNTEDARLTNNKYWGDIVDIYYDWDKY